MLDYESVGAAGSMLGTRALQVFDETTSVVRCVSRWNDFYQHESCGKCTPCREGTYWMKEILHRLEAGKGTEGDIDLLLDVADNIDGRSFCALGDAAAQPVKSGIRYFREEFEQGLHTPAWRAVPLRSQRTVLRSCVMTAPSDQKAPAPVEEVTLTIDGIEVSVPKGTLVIRAAERVGIEIPRFCDHPLLKPAGACRQCLVEVSAPDREGNVRPMPKPQTSCTLEATPGMQVSTQQTSPVAEKAQRGQIGVPAGQPPAGLPGLRQGWRVPAAEPGARPRVEHLPVQRRQAHLPQADQDLLRDPARPRPVHLVPAVHAVPGRDRR